MQSSSPFVIDELHNITRTELPPIKTPDQLRDRLHFLRDDRIKNIHAKQQEQPLPRVTCSARKSIFEVQIASKVKLLSHRARRHHQAFRTLLRDHSHYHHLTMTEAAVKAGSIGKFLLIIGHCERNCKSYDLEHITKGEMHNGYPFLIAAIQKHRLEMVRLLIGKGADPNVAGPPPHKLPAIIYAAITGYIPMIELLVEHGAVCTEHDIKLVKQRCRYQQRGKTLPNEVAVKQWLNKYWSVKLLKATLLGNENAVLVILGLNEHSKICNARDHKRNAPIHVACASGHRKIVELLLKHSPKTISMMNGSYMTPLCVAFLRDRLNVAQYLMRLNARMTVKEFKKTLESHFPTDENTKGEYIERFSSLILHAVDTKDKKALLPVIASHLKKLNCNSVLAMRQIVQLVTSVSCHDTLAAIPQTPTSFHGPHAISNEMIVTHLKMKKKRRRQSKIGSLPETPLRRYKSLQIIHRSAATPQRLRVSRSTPELRSNIKVERSHAAKMAEIAQSISDSRFHFAEKLDDVIKKRMNQSKKQRKARVTKRKIAKWRRASAM